MRLRDCIADSGYVGTEEAAEKAMIYLAHDPVVKQLKEKDLFVKEPYLGKGGIRSAALVRVVFFTT